MAKRKLTAAERAQWEAERARADANAEWLRQLAEEGLADLNADRVKQGLPPIVKPESNAQWLREMVEARQAGEKN